MLSFEEFFTKKKIDLIQLRAAEPVLFSEFKSEFKQMGEKSFDHTKKFWFNKLRRTYHIQEEPAPAKNLIEKTEIASQAEPLSSPTIEQKAAYTPRFKVIKKPEPDVQDTITHTPNTEPIPEELGRQPFAEQSTQTDESKSVYKPRFKPHTASIIKPDQAENTDKQNDPSFTREETGMTEPKPVYKPRFNSQNIRPKAGPKD